MDIAKPSDMEEAGEALPEENAYGIEGEIKTFGIRTFRELNLTMRSLTAAPHDSPKYQDVVHLLPLSNAIENFGFTTQVGIYRLAVSYCAGEHDIAARQSQGHKAYPSKESKSPHGASEKSKSVAQSSLPIGLEENAALTPYLVVSKDDALGEDPTAVATIFVDNFWQTDMLASADREQLIARLGNFIAAHEGYACGENGCWTNPMAVMQDACIVMLASATSTFL